MKKLILAFSVVGMLAGCQQSANLTEVPESKPVDGGLAVPVHYETLDNGLKVVLSEDSTAPIVAVGVYYNIGFRIEQKTAQDLRTYLSI